MKVLRYQQTLDRFIDIVKNRKLTETMMAVIIDSPWLPGYLNVDTMDFYFDKDTWFRSYTQVLDDLPDIAFIPGSWIEFGMAAEPSGWGVRIQWNHSSPPAIQPFPGGMKALLKATSPDPEKDGLMPVILKQYENVRMQLTEKGIQQRIAAGRGPLAIASHLLGVTEFLTTIKTDPESCLILLDMTTELCVKWLHAQLQRMEDPVGILVLDDIVGMMGHDDAERFAFPFLKKIFTSYPNLIHIFHNDTPNEKVFEGLSKMDIDVFNFSHKIPIEKARELLGKDIVLMGNIPPLDILVRGTEDQVRQATENLLQKVSKYGPILISGGGGVSPGTRIENLKAVRDVVEDFKKS
jgi:uroporphyrinogen decarboxylase